MSQEKIDILQRALIREKAARKQAEKILEYKATELYKLSEDLKESNLKLEKAVKDKTSQLQGVFENIVDAYVVIDLLGNILKMNDAAMDLLESDSLRDDINLMSLVHPDEYDHVSNSFKVLSEKGLITDFKTKIITKEKTTKLVHINASIIYDDGIAVAAQGIVRDITIERERSLILEMINDLAKSILGMENIHEIAWEITEKIATYLSSDDVVIYLVNENDTLEQIAAFKNKVNAEKKIVNKITLPIGQGIVGCVAESGVSELINDTQSDKRYIKDDEIRNSEITVPIISDDKVIGIIDSEHPQKNFYTKKNLKTLENVASLVAMQLQSALNLRERLKTELKNTELLKKLEKSNDELEEYAHVVSHDLKSPLRSIYALVDWIKSDNADKLDSNTLENFSHIEMTLEKMEQLISDILEYSSIGSTNENRISIKLDKLIKDLVSIMYVPNHINIEIPDNLPVIKGDRIKLQQLFQNLIGNAVKFIDKKEGTINISVEDAQTHYKFSIQDNGMGIEEKFHSKIFDVFHTLKKSKDSTGIGLSIVKKIVNLHEGEIWLESELNKGTTFYFTLKK